MMVAEPAAAGIEGNEKEVSLPDLVQQLVTDSIALNLLKQKTAKCGVKAKRLKAAWDEDYLLKALDGLSD
jgi:hypothetical protein